MPNKTVKTGKTRYSRRFHRCATRTCKDCRGTGFRLSSPLYPVKCGSCGGRGQVPDED